MSATRRRGSVRRALVKVVTGLVLAFIVTRVRDGAKGVKKSEPWPKYISMLLKAGIALFAVGITAFLADKAASKRIDRAKSSTDGKEVEFSIDDNGMPSEETLREHLHTCKINLAKATELRQEQGDLSTEQNKALDAKFAEMRDTITMTEELLQHVVAGKSTAFSERRAQRRARLNMLKKNEAYHESHTPPST